MNVITISRSYGSAGSLFGKRLAERLGYKYVDDGFLRYLKTHKEAANVLLRNLEDEKSPDISDRFTELIHNKSYFKTAITVALYSLIIKTDVVVVGGGAHLLLEEYPSRIRIQIIRDINERIFDIMNEKGLSEEDAIDLVNKKDKEKKKFIEFYFDRDLNDPSSFDIIFNASSVKLEHALDIMELYAERFFSRIDQDEARLFAAKRLLEHRAKLVVMHHELATKSKVEFEALAEDALLVKGIVGGEKEKDRLIKALWGLKGINKVTDHLKIGTLSRLIY
ncbi:MAG TPA: cytidylate kinase family protein [Syntrophorhabdaceae bacterium]|nr:cytidylate kinase family protein [Syntrophorhabdaceae bacterium]HOT43047.1 cytidylate kinase family protein [Syntrophorhabdaceae bacterium]HPC66475.1 cytidylate kinase family protein [Syntrophorhabdaceae bacterium]HQE79706.1 cytidylate kinase family protein [Syntrophorhabdaceae bacterium]HQH43278.1 cytidylate kinase family protein [Syntrophorhabdaceae bacterium]